MSNNYYKVQYFALLKNALEMKKQLDYQQMYNKAIIFNRETNNACIVDIISWKEHNNGQLELQLIDGSYILTSSYDTKLLYVNEYTIQPEEIAKSINGKNTNITYLTYNYEMILK